MKSVITGDIIQSQKVINPENWIKPLKKLFRDLAKTSEDWDIFRGDSFQLIIHEPEKSLLAAIQIKSCIKQVKNLDVRMAIGIGDINYQSKRVTESNGEAFVFSGKTFEGLKKSKINLAVKTPWEKYDFDNEINLYLKLSLIAMDNWTPGSAEAVSILFKNPKLLQKDLSKKLNIKQSSVSDRIKRAYYSEISELELFFNTKVKQLINL